MSTGIQNMLGMQGIVAMPASSALEIKPGSHVLVTGGGKYREAVVETIAGRYKGSYDYAKIRYLYPGLFSAKTEWVYCGNLAVINEVEQ